MSDSGSLQPPLDVLAAWHRHGTAHFASMRRLAHRESADGIDAVARRHAEAVVAYFDRSIAVHCQDQEQDLFPALIESMAGSDPVCLREMIAGLTQGHRALAAAWRGLRPAFAALAAGTPAAPDRDLVEAMIVQCERLFRLADEEMFPMASRLLSDEARVEILAGMLARRRRGPPEGR